MLSQPILRAVLAQLLLASLRCIATAQSVDVSDVALGKEHVDQKVLSKYQGSFERWRPRIPDVWCDCTDPNCFCPGGGLKQRVNTTGLPSQKPTDSPMTATSESSRTIIVRVTSATPTATAYSDETTAKVGESASADAQHPLAKRIREVTNTFYDRQLSGEDGNVLPLILEHPVTLDSSVMEPITILATARTQFFSSFISASLVADLNLTSSIGPTNAKPIFLPELDLSTLLGYEAHPVGLLSLKLLVGRDDQAYQANFTVVHAPENKNGTWHPDVIVGMQFLNDLQALEFTAEFGGGSGTGVRNGLGVFVQRVFEEDGEKTGHGEL